MRWVERRDEEHRSHGDAEVWVPCRIWKTTQGLDWCLGASACPRSVQSRLLVVPTHLQGPSRPETQGTEASHTWRLEHSGFFFSTLT